MDKEKIRKKARNFESEILYNQHGKCCKCKTQLWVEDLDKHLLSNNRIYCEKCRKEV